MRNRRCVWRFERRARTAGILTNENNKERFRSRRQAVLTSAANAIVDRWHSSLARRTNGTGQRNSSLKFLSTKRFQVIDSLSISKCKRSVAMLAIAAATALPALAFEQSAPFGFAWGPLDKIPKPSLALKDANVTVLLYRRDRLQSNEMPDTEVILLDVCRKEGLQQISWVSRALSTNEATAKFVQVVTETVQKYGESKPTPEGALAWENGHIEALSVSEPNGTHRILMVSRGPDFGACSAEHDLASNQSLRTRWLRRVELPK